ncbi:MAG TPA: helix-turn-helix transcriptional regulator [Mycobacterium sp.]|nr:helix-turn-helix transcriptional regulator [Mycobacterium sp.]
MPSRQKLVARRRAAFGSRVRALRTERGWSQERLAHQAGLDRTYVGSVERGERNIALDNIWLLADTLGVTPPTSSARTDSTPPLPCTCARPAHRPPFQR